MTYQDVAVLIESVGLPYAYDHFDEGDASPPPFICFFFEDSDDLAADNSNYQRIRPLTLELYTDNKDFSLEETVEDVLNGAGLVFSRSEVYIDAERMYEVIYSTSIIITEELNNGE